MANDLKLSIELSINPEMREVSPELDRLLNDLEQYAQGTRDFYQATTNLLKELLVSAVERIKMENEKVNPEHPFSKEELEKIGTMVFENWRASITVNSHPVYNIPIEPPVTVK